MAKEKQTRRMIAMALAAAVTMSSVPVVALAEDGADSSTTTTTNTTTTTETSGPDTTGEGTKESPKVTVTVTADKTTTTTTTTTTDNSGETPSTSVKAEAEATTTTKTETDTSWSDASENKTVDYDGEKVETKVTETKTETVDGGTPTVTQPETTVREHTTTDDTTTTVETDENGTTTTVENVKTEKGTREDGTVVDSTVTNTEVTEKDANGNWVETNGVEEGDVTTTGEYSPDVTVPLVGEGVTPVGTTDDNKGIFVGESTPVVDEVTDDIPVDENDPEYDYTTANTEENRKVIIEMGDEVFFVGDGEDVADSNLTPVQSYWAGTEQDMRNGNDDYYIEHGYITPESLNNKPDGYDYVYLGYGEYSNYYADYTYVNKYGNTVSSDSDMIQFRVGEVETKVIDGKEVVVKKGTDHIVYCADVGTGAHGGWWYRLENLEDTDYYDDSVADNIRAVVNNGYWGTKDAEDTTDGKYETGSLDDVKAKLQAKYDQAAEIKNDDGTVSKAFPLTQDDINNLTEGEALAATQMSIWKYGNAYTKIDLEASDYIWGDAANKTDEEKAASQARINALYGYLIGLSEETTETNSTEIITEDKFIDQMSFTVEDKVEGHVNNQDDNEDNDAYNTSLNFALVVTPDENKDDLVVKVVKVLGTDNDGNLVTEEVAKARLAGDGTNDTGFTNVTKEADGSYTLSGLELIENDNMKFNLKLEGTQYLEKGVYVYSSEVRTGGSTSQTFVGIAEGDRQVDVGMEIDLSFDVKEGKITKKHSWRKTWKEEPAPNHGGGGGMGGDELEETEPTPEEPTPEEPAPEEPTPENPTPEDPGKVLGDDEELLDIGDEGTPRDDMLLADAEDELIAATGDSNHMAGAFGGMFAALAGMLFLRKKKEN